MIDLSNYPNLSNLANSLGGVRKAALNKKLLENAEDSWRKLSQEEVVKLEQEAPYAKKIMQAYVTPTAILYMTNHALFVIPTRDIIWVYVSTTTMKMNFIPYNKVHNIFVVTRDGASHNIGMANTGGFSKKRPCDPAVTEIQATLANVRPGIIYGYSDQVAAAMKNNLPALVQSVDAQSCGQQMQQTPPMQ